MTAALGYKLLVKLQYGTAANTICLQDFREQVVLMGRNSRLEDDLRINESIKQSQAHKSKIMEKHATHVYHGYTE